MPLRGNPVCLKCETEESPLWTNAENLGAICLDCINEAKEENKSDDEEKAEKKKQLRTLRTTRHSGKSRSNSTTQVRPPPPKGRSRRCIFKKSPRKAPTAVATPVTSDWVYYKGNYYQEGDIVSLMDEDGDTYYAQIRGFLTDQYCEKSAVLTWLLPTKESPPPDKYFDPASYVLGPEEDVPRNLNCMQFMMHAPSDYYKSKTTPYPRVYPTCEPGYIWTRLDPIKRLLSTDDDLH